MRRLRIRSVDIDSRHSNARNWDDLKAFEAQGTSAAFMKLLVEWTSKNQFV